MADKSKSTYKLGEIPGGSKNAPPPPPQPKAPVQPESLEKQPGRPAPPKKVATPDSQGRLVSLDAYRGFIMIMLAANGFGIHQLLSQPNDSLTWKILDHGTWERIAFHFDHPPWGSSFVPGTQNATDGNPWLHVSVSFWDLIQPAFMFMVGVAMPFSFARRKAAGAVGWKLHLHALWRAITLTLLGVFLYSLNCDRTNWIFPNVLAQIGLGYFFAYLLLGRRLWIQLLAFVLILVGDWGLFALTPPPADYDPVALNVSQKEGELYEGFFHHWSKHAGAGQQFDQWFLNLFPRPTTNGRMVSEPDTNRSLYHAGGYVTLNFFPSIATTLLGILCGQLLLIPESHGLRLGILIGAALTCLALGVLTGATVCPIVKRIWTPSWVLFSGGYVIGMLALFYLLFDILPLKKLAFPLVVVGMNSLAAYMIGQLLRSWILQQVIGVHFSGLIRWSLGTMAAWTGMITDTSIPHEEYGMEIYQAFEPIIDNTAAFIVMWLFLYWMYRQKFFIRA